jgi:hypothetical protein
MIQIILALCIYFVLQFKHGKEGTFYRPPLNRQPRSGARDIFQKRGTKFIVSNSLSPLERALAVRLSFRRRKAQTHKKEEKMKNIFGREELIGPNLMTLTAINKPFIAKASGVEFIRVLATHSVAC